MAIRKPPVTLFRDKSALFPPAQVDPTRPCYSVWDWVMGRALPRGCGPSGGPGLLPGLGGRTPLPFGQIPPWLKFIDYPLVLSKQFLSDGSQRSEKQNAALDMYVVGFLADMTVPNVGGTSGTFNISITNRTTGEALGSNTRNYQIPDSFQNTAQIFYLPGYIFVRAGDLLDTSHQLLTTAAPTNNYTLLSKLYYVDPDWLALFGIGLTS